ncbi:hypothetical protein HPP92_009444 [Vanilla planifolia]|uniref:Uncharacterized protein n=1 Tax=Vanilla planifolia TaxID=51239 RepID=A0A835REA3_VANPL|nr:hypothetical protein HPP92_009444 [Vanilla planifolia]
MIQFQLKSFLCQDSFDDTSGELVEQSPKPELNLTFESSCHEMNSESKMKKEIVDSNFLCLESRTLETSCSSSDALAPPIFSNLIILNSLDKVNYSTLNSHMDSFGDKEYFFSGRNDIQVPENTTGISTSASENMPSTVPAATTAALQGIPVDTMRKSSINIWTNGGLLGLEPSKPSDISVDYGNDDMCDSMPVAKAQAEVLCNGDLLSKTTVGKDRSNHVLCFPEQTEGSGSSSLEVNIPKQKDRSIFSAGNDIPLNKELLSVGFIQNHTDISAGISSLAHRFLDLNGSSYHKEYKKLSENLASKLTSSGFCSPPLEHIKLSCQPANDSIYNKLKLELCRINLEGSMGDVLFPSFQLLSESLQPVLEDVLESEDDTFCRSCPYSSDDLLSLHSESDADVWGDDQRDASYRMVATDYIKGST